ncbi:hypothetical protein KPSA3_00521 [Pseudomonas syringae pv. actinidiae]|uniref:Uncharacterized protein n=1 Tax=Pseudomonas syringae pv. actinidiae TaxID=103796 RepID=A0AAN4TII7_PSESF|nr:hypothetical protein KPSA3_00521 [Pseudomonas syringae pv. actinidiae]
MQWQILADSSPWSTLLLGGGDILLDLVRVQLRLAGLTHH